MAEQALAVYYHTHWDREWYMPFRAYQVRLAEVVDEILERLESDALPCFMLDGQTVVLEDYLELRPENRGRLEALVHAGRLSIGPWFVAPDEFLVSGESLIRNLARGIRTADAWGCRQFTGYLPDTFGHAADMPMLLTKLGIDSAIVWRGVNPRQSLFWWQSPNGDRVRTLHLTEGYFQMMLDDWELGPEERQTALCNTVARLQAVCPAGAPVLLPQGADHLGPTPVEGRRMLQACYPGLWETTPEKFMASLNGLDGLETIAGELTDNSAAFLLPGVYSARLYLKQANRRLEHALTRRLEPLLAMTQGFGGDVRHPAHELDTAWKTLNLNHPHDSICGCSVDEVHRENEVRFDQVRELSDALQARAEAALSDVGGQQDWVIFNTGDRPYTGVVPVVEDLAAEDAPLYLQPARRHWVLDEAHLSDPHRIPMAHLKKYRREGWIWVQDIPPFGMKVVKKGTTADIVSVSVTATSLENEFLAVTVAPDGTVSIRDKRTGAVHAGTLFYRGWQDEGDSYNVDPVQDPVLAEYEGSEGVVHAGPLVGELRLIHRFPAQDLLLLQTAMATHLRLTAGSPVLEINIAPGLPLPVMHVIQLGFRTPRPVDAVQAEGHFNIVTRRYDPDYRLRDQPPAGKMKEHKTNTGPIQRFVSANGQSWITEGLTEYEVAGDCLYITILRTFNMLSRENLGTRGAPAGPPLVTVEGMYLHRPSAHSRLAWLPTPENPAELYAEASRFYGDVWGVSGTGSRTGEEAKSLIHWDNPTVVSSACYWRPGEGLFLRLVNPTDQPQTLTLHPGFANAGLAEVDFLERPLATLPEPRLTLPPYDVKTLRFGDGAQTV